MTTEEFEGLLMATLHGPSADKIVQRMVEVMRSNGILDGVMAKVFAEVHGPLHAEDVKMMTVLAMLAVADHLPNIGTGRDMMKRIMREAAIKDVLVDELREFVKAATGDVAGLGEDELGILETLGLVPQSAESTGS